MSRAFLASGLRLIFPVALMALVGGAVAKEFAGEKKESAGEKKAEPSDRWRAWAVTEGAQTKLVVEGIYARGGPGLVVTLKEAAPQGINPKILVLDVKMATLPGFWPAISHPVPACYVKAPYAARYESVHLRFPDGNSHVIEKVIDAGKGPN